MCLFLSRLCFSLYIIPFSQTGFLLRPVTMARDCPIFAMREEGTLSPCFQFEDHLGRAAGPLGRTPAPASRVQSDGIGSTHRPPILKWGGTSATPKEMLLAEERQRAGKANTAYPPQLPVLCTAWPGDLVSTSVSDQNPETVG